MNLPNYKEAMKRTKEKVIKEMYEKNSDIDHLGKDKTYFIKTYGCQMNEHDTEVIKALLEEMDFTEIDNYLEADLILLNTCSIRENAHNKAFGMLGRIKHLKESRGDVIVGICGCMAQEEPVVNKILDKYHWVNFVIGTHNIHRLPTVLNESIRKNKQEIEVLSKEGNIIEGVPVKRESKYKAYVNIIYGCDKFCTYCIVPFTRGKQRSREKEDIINEVETLVKDGYKEVTLLGQNVNAYGKDFDYQYTMEDLLEDVAKTGIARIKFMTSHPWDFTDKMIEVISKYDNIMPFIHLPVQSGSTRVLKLMGRRYTKDDYLTLYNKIKKSIPNVSFSTDIIVGFPGESEEDFIETLDLVDKCKFDNAYTFIYSPRVGTPAAKLKDNTTLAEKEERLQILNTKVNNYFLENNKSLIDTVVPVLVEGISDKKGSLVGYTNTNRLINFIGDNNLIGNIVNVKVTKAKTWSLDGELYEG